jgi:NAD(P)-dependent dehydrogenase (short-subunit alcohol dehydrogenase family)
MNSTLSTTGAHQHLAVVIGAGGMSMAAARRVAQRYRVLIADLDAARATQRARQLQEEGGQAIAFECDVTDEDAVAALAQEVDRLGQFRALVHVAGLSPSMADFATIMRVNLAGVARVAHSLLPLATNGTAAVLISSLAAHNFRPAAAIAALLIDPTDIHFVERLRKELGVGNDTPEVAYQLSKWGVNSFCRRNALAWGKRGARIVSLSPGLIATPQGALELEVRASKRRLLAQSPLQREGTMHEIADAIEFLVSDKASFISGTDLLVDGGLGGVIDSTAGSDRFSDLDD